MVLDLCTVPCLLSKMYVPNCRFHFSLLFFVSWFVCDFIVISFSGYPIFILQRTLFITTVFVTKEFAVKSILLL